jgi:predicted MFS family arabinose efflux permease
MEVSTPIEGLVHAGAHGRRLSSAGLASAIVVGIIGASVIFVTPGFLALIAAKSGLDDAHLGYVAAWDIDATAVAIGISTFLLTRCDWRWAVGIGLGLIALGNVGTAFAAGYGEIAAARVVAGAGEGICIGFSFAALGRAANPDRAFSIYLVAGAATSSAVLYSLPAMQLLWSPQALFLCVGLIALACGLCLFHFPNGRASEDDIFAGGGRINWNFAAAALLCVFLYFFATGAMWSYTERIGQASDLSASVIARGLSIGTLAGVAGAGLAGWLPGGWGRGWPLIVAGAVSVVSFQLLLGSVPPLAFIAAIVLMLFAWNFSQPLLSGICAEADPHGRVVCAMAAIQTFGMGLGPAAAGATLHGRDFSVAIWSSCAILALSLLIVTVAIRRAGGR